jgi:AraC-like DNA-binding protein
MAGDAGACADTVDADERDGCFREVERSVFGKVPFVERAAERSGALRNGATRSHNVVALPVGMAAFHRQRRPRDRRPVGQGEVDHVVLQVMGAASLQGDVINAHPYADAGGICMFDAEQMPAIQAGATSTLSIAMPRHVLKKAIGSQSLHGTVLKAHAPMTPLIAAVLRELCSLESPLSDMQAIAAQDALVTLLSAALKGDVQNEVADVSPRGTGLRQRIVGFITRNVHLLELSPEFLCRRFNVSRAHLYRAFAKDGGVAKVLRDIRLDAAHRELTGPTRTSRSITEIAYALGFSSGNQLLRSFRARFGVTPSEARTARER